MRYLTKWSSLDLRMNLHRTKGSTIYLQDSIANPSGSLIDQSVRMSLHAIVSSRIKVLKLWSV